MRQAFLEALVDLAERDERVVLLTGDLGYTVLEPFAERFPDRFFNIGVAEQNMIGVATGLAEDGYVPFAYSIATFATLRPYEFLRNGPALHRLPVRVIGVGGGFDYGHNGMTHYALEDIGIIRQQPGIAVVIPADADQARAAVATTASHPGPLYMRVGKGAEPVPGLEGRFELGRLDIVAEGRDGAIVAMGSLAAEAVRARELLAGSGVQVAVAIVSSFNPSPTEDLAGLLGRVPVAATLEPHYRWGALGSLVSEVVADRGLGIRVQRHGVSEVAPGVTGSTSYLEQVHGLTASAVAESLLTAQPVASS